MLFNDSDLAHMQEQLSFKNMDEMQALLTELLYGKVI